MGANLVFGGVEFRVWAPEVPGVAVELGSATIALTPEGNGVWAGSVEGIAAGARYRFRMEGGGAFPDPYSRSQPEGPHGPSEVVDPAAFEWTDAGWRGLRAEGLIIYELHVGAYTPEGTFDALIPELRELKLLGVNAIELMPIVEVPGKRNWGYDGVDLFAPTRNYGGPAALKRLVDAAHGLGIGIILDVVYNHFGPDGNYLLQFAKEYLSDRHKTAWGDAVNYDGYRSEHVRQFVIDNACYWLSEYRLDGLRLDAAFDMIDESPRHILAELVGTARASLSPSRTAVFIAETHQNDVRFVQPPREGGYGFDAVWVDDFHHAVHTAASHEHSGYYADYAGTTAELARTINGGWLFDGSDPRDNGATRGTPATNVPASGFVYAIQNHDQVGNRAFGRRFSQLVGADAQRMWATLHLLLPFTPLLFMGQEFAASTRFYYFTDHAEALGRQVTEGRRREFARFREFADPQGSAEIPDPQAERTFLDSKLKLQERDEGTGGLMYTLHRALLALRRSDGVLARQDRERLRATAGTEQLLLVHLWHGREHRLIAANTGVAIDASPSVAGVPEGLAALPWRVVLSTEERRFGGTGDSVRLDGALLSMPPRTVAWLAARSEIGPLQRLGAWLRRSLRTRGGDVRPRW